MASETGHQGKKGAPSCQTSVLPSPPHSPSEQRQTTVGVGGGQPALARRSILALLLFRTASTWASLKGDRLFLGFNIVPNFPHCYIQDRLIPRLPPDFPERAASGAGGQVGSSVQM